MVTFRLVLVRHGETAANAEGRLQGQIDVPLNATGERQARRAGEALSRLRFTKAFSSDLSRARSTAQLILAGVGGEAPPLREDPRLRERSFGSFEGRLKTEVISELEKKGIKFNQTITGEGGETLEQVTKRMHEFVKDLCRSMEGCEDDTEVALVVSHGMALLCLLRRLVALGCAGLPPRPDFPMPNTAFSEVVVRYSGKTCEMECVEYNQHRHIEGL